ncbi:ferric reductase-like transmembrane domain-containing protein [Streptomyces sp. NPDC006925]|uniref:ferredoxin reductase family protein n=1 Tax=Streptomyces sp. NPDC006925 TaxID=3364768 RepID=UPI0036CA768B
MAAHAARSTPPRRGRAGLPLPGRDTWAVLLTSVAGWLGAAGVVALWWADTGSVVGAAGWLTGAGRLTGLLAGYLCAVLVVLMARIPMLDRTLGTDRLARWHAAAGRYTISLILAHAVLIIEGYALTGGTGPVRQTARLVLDYPDMLKATAACGLFLATAVVSARAARRRLSYETWYFLHLLTYAAIFLAFGHQLSNGAEFTGDPAARAAWYALYATAAGLLVVFRLLAPLRFGLRHRLRVAEVRPEGPGVVSVRLTGRRLGEMAAREGQFFRWRFLDRRLWWTATPYSLSAPVGPHGMRITVKAAGGHSAALARLRPGTRVWAEGPYGAMTAARARSSKSLLLAGGVGIAPLRALFETLPGDPVLLFRARTPNDLVLREELDAIAAARGARVHYSVSEPPGLRLPMEPGALRALVPDVAERDCFVCGPPGMAEAARSALVAAGVPSRRIHQEAFAL